MDKAALLAKRLPEEDLELPGVGVVRLRGLSRAQALAANDLTSEQRELRWLHLGFVDPAMTEEDVQQWRDAATYAEIELVAEKIAELSGMAETSVKDATKSIGDGS
jgi:hypothetical protein